jgi:hypothetical protein
LPRQDGSPTQRRDVFRKDVVELELEAEVKPALGRPASAGIEVAIGGIKEEQIVGSVELDVFAAQPHELVDLLTQDFGDVGQEALQGWIGAA